MNEDLIRSLLYRSEGTGLDFKSEQYRFIKAGEHEKSELLKDVLAMANSWRDGPAYIVLGFREQKPQLPLLTGISESIDDAALQQFIGSKVAPNLVFTYEEGSYLGEHVALLTIPKQVRPFYCTKDSGKVRSNVALFGEEARRRRHRQSKAQTCGEATRLERPRRPRSNCSL